MRRRRKTKSLPRLLFIALLVILVLIALVVVAVGLFANKALDIAIESAGTKALNVGVSVNDVDLSILRGKLSIRNLTINNPPGYQHKRLLELGLGRVTVDTRSLLSDTVNIENITLDGMNVVLEQRGISGNNLQDIIEALPPQDRQESEPGGKKLHVGNLEITNVAVRVKLLPVPGKVDTLTIKLAPIRMTDLGSEDDLDTVDLSRRILLAVAGGIVKQGADLLPEEMFGSLVSELRKLGALPDVLLQTGGKLLEIGAGAGKGATEAGKGLGEEVIKGVGGLGKGITDGLKGILDKKDEKK